MNITVYNRAYLYVGFLIATVGGCLGDEKIIPIYLEWALMIAGIVLMLLSMKKPKETKSEEL